MHYILDQVQLLRERYHTSRPEILAVELGIDIQYHDIGSLKGYYLVDRKRRYIVLNNSLDEGMLQLVCAHELGHDRLHQELAGFTVWHERNLFDSRSKAEREANLFAAELLIPDLEIHSLLNQHLSLETISKCLALPVDLVLFKIQALRMTGWKIELPWATNSGFLG